MKKIDAMNLLGLRLLTQSELKNAYRKACAKYHPDRNPGGLEMMKAINVAYDTLKALPDDTDGISDKYADNYGDKMNDAINAVIALTGINIEICGNWIWLSGDTKQHKDTIKKAGYRWSPKKLSWYFRPEEYKSFNRSSYSMDEIRVKHGSQAVKGREYFKLA